MSARRGSVTIARGEDYDGGEDVVDIQKERSALSKFKAAGQAAKAQAAMKPRKTGLGALYADSSSNGAPAGNDHETCAPSDAKLAGNRLVLPEPVVVLTTASTA